MEYLQSTDSKKLRKLHAEINDTKVKYRLLIAIHYAEGKSGPEIANLLNISKDQVYYWLNRFELEGYEGLTDRDRSGRPRKIDYEDLKNAISKQPSYFGIQEKEWNLNSVYKYLTDIQQVSIAKNYVYEVLEKLNIDLNKNSANDTKIPDLRTRKGKIISSLHVEVLHDAGLMLDAPIHKIITEKGIKPVLKVIDATKYTTTLQGESENGLLTIKYEEYS